MSGKNKKWGVKLCLCAVTWSLGMGISVADTPDDQVETPGISQASETPVAPNEAPPVEPSNDTGEQNTEPPPPPTGDQAEVAPADLGEVQEIVVTARKRKEKLVDTPVSVEALSGDALNSSAITDLTGLATQVPQLLISKLPSGAGAVFSIRGIGSPGVDAGVDSTVSAVFDGVQLSRGLISTLGFFDVQSVQVLKGPQALFFGKNSPAGVVSVTSNGPSDRWEGYARQGYEFEAVEPYVEAAYGGPITDTLKVRVAVKVDKSNGFLTNDAEAMTIPNPIAGSAPSGTLPATDSLGGAASAHAPTDASQLGRLTMEWTPTDKLNAALRILGAHLANDGSGDSFQTKCVLGPDAKPVEIGITDPTGSCEPGHHISSYTNPLQFVTPTPFQSSHKSPYLDFSGTLDSLELNYNEGPLTITSVTGYALYGQKQSSSQDAQFDIFAAAIEQDYSQASEEIRVTSHFDSPVNFVAGALYEKSRLVQSQAIYLGLGLFPADPSTGRYDSADNLQLNKGNTLSPFAQAVWKITPNLEFDAGARWTREAKSTRQYNSYLNPFSLVPSSSFVPVGTIVSGSTTFYNLSPEATLTWHPLDETMVYAAFKTGYKSGGYSMSTLLQGSAGTTGADILFNPEKSSGGEIGTKTRFMDGKVQITGAVYDYRYRDLQQSIFNSATTSFSVKNAAAASTRGVESDATWRVVPEVTLSAALSYNHGRFSSYTNSPCYAGQAAPSCTSASTEDLSGKRLPYSSDFIEQIGFDWDHALPIGTDYRFTLGSNLHYLSNFNNSSTLNPVGAYDGQYLLDAHLGVYPESDRWHVELSARNLLDKQYLLIAADRPGGTAANGAADVYGPTNRPREIWLQVTEHF